ncbi:ketoacyl-ACP synthase III [Aquirufa sp. OSTEICH-129A]
MKAVIKSIASYLPEFILTNENLAQEFPEWQVDKILNKVGIRQRHISGNESITEMAVKASVKLFESSILKPVDVDYILLCTQSPDYILPTSACILQNELNIPITAGALDFNQGCSGFIYGLSLAKGLIAAGIAKNILLITSEAYSKHINIEDKSNRAIFGDAATATWIGTGTGLEINNFKLGTDGKGANNLIIKNGGSRFPKDECKSYIDINGILRDNNCLYMNGSEIFNFTLESIPGLVKNTLTINNLKFDDVNWFVFHQANAFMLQHLRKKIGIPEEKFPIELEMTGNTVSSTIPLVLEKLINKKNIKTNQNLMLTGFGVGYSWGSVIVKSNSIL